MISEGAIFADAIGIESAVVGRLRLNTAFRPVFSLFDAGLVAVAVEALTLAQPVDAPREAGSASLGGVDSQRIEKIGRLVNAGNIANLDADDLPAYLHFGATEQDDPGSAQIELDAILTRLADNEIGAGRVVLLIKIEDKIELARATALADAARVRGMRVGLEGFGDGAAASEWVRAIKPETVALDSTWFGRLSNSPRAAGLLATLVSQITSDGAGVLVRQIDTANALRLASDAGVTLFQGDLLARAAPAGALFGPRNLQLASLVSSEGNVVPLFGRRSG